MLPKRETNRYLKTISALAPILVLGPTIVAIAVLAINGNEKGAEILESTPVAITLMTLFGSGLLLLIYVYAYAFIKYFQRSYRHKGDK